jgi:hypothetical protein
MNELAKSLVPTSIEQAWKLAEMLAESSFLPQHLRGKPADIFAICAMGSDLSMSYMQSINNIYVVNGRPSLSADAMVALVLRSGKASYFRCTETTSQKAVYETLRNGDAEPVALPYTIEQARNSGRMGRSPTWKTDPEDMLRKRASSKLARMVYPDVVGGFVTPEEIADSALPKPRYVEPRDVVTEVVSAAVEKHQKPSQIETLEQRWLGEALPGD